MEPSTQTTFRGIPHSDAIAGHIEHRADKLPTFFDRIVSCRVTVESPHRHKHKGYPFRVLIELGVPQKEIVVSHDVGGTSSLDPYAAIDVAFDEMQLRLQDHTHVLRGDVKAHEHARHGTIAKLFAYEGYGFIETEGGDELYFHKNAVLNGGFDRMQRGARVRFTEAEAGTADGGAGAHASSVVVLRGRAKRRAVES
jgi:cold shock CspA family protein/ribosome-associated translation inhibitor RaiA